MLYQETLWHELLVLWLTFSSVGLTETRVTTFTLLQNCVWFSDGKYKRLVSLDLPKYQGTRI